MKSMNFMRNTLRPNSLRFRLLASTVLLVAIVLPITAFALTSYYRGAIETTFDQRLKVHLDNLVVVSLRLEQDNDGQDGEEQLVEGTDGQKPEIVPVSQRKQIELGEPLFKRPFSGWYWQIRALDGAQDTAFISDSLLDQRIASLPELKEGEPGEKLKTGYVSGPEGQYLRVVEQLIIAGGDDAGEKGERFIYTVAISSSELDGQVSQFRNMLLLALGMLGLGLILAGFAQVRYGLAPLSVISRKLNDIRAGKADHLVGEFPAEIEPLQIELNALIRSNRDIVERARTHVGNLAHALKTPLSVISNEIDKALEEGGRQGEQRVATGFATTIAKQAEIMNDQVRHHLDRARMAAQVGIIGNSTLVEPVIRSLARTLEKIYNEKGVELVCECEGDLLFRGEKQDLEEMLGNLLDNAFKWAASEVFLFAVAANNKPGFLAIRVDDDGPGLSADKRAQAIKRGQRLDENLPGSGLGLSIVADLAHLYEGGFHLEASSKGGLRAELLLPVAKA
jgi:signal transduction histidine kinase